MSSDVLVAVTKEVGAVGKPGFPRRCHVGRCPIHRDACSKATWSRGGYEISEYLEYRWEGYGVWGMRWFSGEDWPWTWRGGWYCFHSADPGVSVSSHWPFTLRVLIKVSPWEEGQSKCSTLTQVKGQGSMSAELIKSTWNAGPIECTLERAPTPASPRVERLVPSPWWLVASSPGSFTNYTLYHRSGIMVVSFDRISTIIW